MNLLIVEDENIIRQGLIITVGKLSFQFQSIYEAANGLEALELCRQYKPDLILTDIKMPLMDGLTFIKNCRELLPASYIIILSGYDDFRFAQQAIKYGVTDYLLKPSSTKELKKVFTGVIRKWEQAQRLQAQLLKNILKDDFKKEKIAEYLTLHSIQFSKPVFCMLGYLLYTEGAASSEAFYSVQPGEDSLVIELLGRQFTCFPLPVDERYHYILLNLTKNEAQLLPDVLTSLCESLQRSLSCVGACIYMSLSAYADETAGLPLLYKQAKEILHTRLFHPQTHLFLPDLYKTFVKNMPSVPETKLETLYHYFIGSSELDLEKHYGKFIRQISGVDNTSPRYLIECVHALEAYLSTRLLRENYLSKKSSFLLNIEANLCASNNLKELTELTFPLLLQCKMSLSLHKESGGSSPVEQAILYIEKNYQTEMDLNDISNMVSMNSSYFSTLFKKKTGMNFINYVQNVRIEKAKDLLINTNLKLYEVSEGVGIFNDKYFCKLFKAHTGMTPTDYRKRNSSVSVHPSKGAPP